MSAQSLTIACSLTDSEFRERRRNVLQKVGSGILAVEELTDGYQYSFPPDGAWITELADLVSHERECCPFLRFDISVEAANGPIRLSLTGPEGTKEFLTSMFEWDVRPPQERKDLADTLS
jgi:hypothetical protein